MKSEEKYFANIENYTNIKNKLDKYSNLLSTVRLFVFLIGVFISILSFIYKGSVYGFVSIIFSLIVFIICVAKHQGILDEANRYKNLIEINENCLARLNGNWANFSDDGNEYIDHNHIYSNDLDLFGHASLFQWINITNTFHGRRTLADLLEMPDKSVNQIKKRQDAIRELSRKIDFCQNLECKGMNIPKSKMNPEELLQYAENKSKLFNKKWLEYIFYVLPEITLALLIIVFFDRSLSFYIPSTLLIIQLIIFGLSYNRVQKNLSSIYGYKRKIKIFQKLFEIIEKEDFKDPYLLELKSSLFRKNKSASQQIKSLESIVNAVDLKYSPLIYFVLNVLVFWDFHCVFALERWKEERGDALRIWFQTLGLFEAMSSLALISQINQDWDFPTFKEEKVSFSAKEMGHPLINQNKRVCNSIYINNEICVVTGSNMSGKTTFLRTIGINLALAYAGAAVCAERLETSVMDIYTSMRISDDLNNGISTFYAELLRIKMIIDNSRNQKPMIFLIDEVFRGTNSNDRVIGARNVILNLYKDWIMGLISTHDFELCDIEKENIKNYNFTEEYIKNEIKFDYKLREGRCKTTNAKYLMKMAGIEILDI